MGIQKFGLVFAFLVGSVSAIAGDIPQCLSWGNPLAINNPQVLHWKRTTANQYRDRAHIMGVVSKLYNDRNGHDHFAISVGRNPNDTIEVIYNQGFGDLPEIREGQQVEACGDYITSTAESPGPNGRVYPASPEGAIIHWVHWSPNQERHDSGFLVIDGVLYGYDYNKARQNPKAPKSQRKNVR